MPMSSSTQKKPPLQALSASATGIAILGVIFIVFFVFLILNVTQMSFIYELFEEDLDMMLWVFLGLTIVIGVICLSTGITCLRNSLALKNKACIIGSILCMTAFLALIGGIIISIATKQLRAKNSVKLPSSIETPVGAVNQPTFTPKKPISIGEDFDKVVTEKIKDKSDWVY